MPVVQFHCPHCSGLFQIDESLSGHHVSCPLCASVVAIPDLTPAPAPGGPAPPPPPEFSPYPVSPTPPDAAFQLGCPLCGGVFQVGREMGGQQVSCPHCYNAVLLPDFEAPPPTNPLPSAPEWSGQPGYATPPGETSMTPAAPAFGGQPDYGYGAPTAPVEAPTPEIPAPASKPPQDLDQEPAPDTMLPPAAKTSPSAPSPRPDAETPTKTRKQHQSKPRQDEGDEFAAPTAAPKPSKTKTPKPVPADTDDLLPPAAKPQSQKSRDAEERRPTVAETDVEEMLPPSAAPQPSTKERKVSHEDELLPPTIEKSRKDLEKATAPEEAAPTRPGVAADGSILVPTEDGGYIALREPIKTVSKGNQEIELRRLTPEEKEARRFKRNVFVAVFGLLFLILTMLVMAFLNQS